MCNTFIVRCFCTCSCVAPAGTSNELDVQNEWEEKTHTQFVTLTADGPKSENTRVIRVTRVTKSQNT